MGKNSMATALGEAQQPIGSSYNKGGGNVLNAARPASEGVRCVLFSFVMFVKSVDKMGWINDHSGLKNAFPAQSCDGLGQRIDAMGPCHSPSTASRDSSVIGILMSGGAKKEGLPLEAGSLQRML
jgi:hypothetical protein